MKILSERMELSQTITSLSGSIRMEKGCQRCDFCQSRTTLYDAEVTDTCLKLFQEKKYRLI